MIVKLLTCLFLVASLTQEAKGQTLVGRPILPLNSGSFSPSDVTGIVYWWVYTDLDTNSVIVTNWTDRIASDLLTQDDSTKRPTNTASGILFGGGTGLTNNPTFQWGTGTVAGDVGSVWFVVAPQTPSAANGTIMADSHGSHMITTTSGGKYSYLLSSGGATDQGSFVSGNLIDYAVTWTWNSDLTTYTNSVLMTTISSATLQPYEQPQRFIGYTTAVAWPFKGYIREIAFFNSRLTTNDLAQLHNYATNIYGYTP